MKQKRYWLRGLGFGLVFYIAIVATAAIVVFSGIIKCNEFRSIGPAVNESFLCEPILIFIVSPTMIAGELLEEIIAMYDGHVGTWDYMYLGLFATVVIYFGVFAFLGNLYGKRKNNDQ